MKNRKNIISFVKLIFYTMMTIIMCIMTVVLIVDKAYLKAFMAAAWVLYMFANALEKASEFPKLWKFIINEDE